METKSTTPKRPLSDFLGILNEKEADLLKKTIERNRKIHRKLHEKRAKHIINQFKVKGDKLVIEKD